MFNRLSNLFSFKLPPNSYEPSLHRILRHKRKLRRGHWNIIFGDSVMVRTSRDDSEAITLDRLILNKLGSNSFSIAHSAYHPGIFRACAEVLRELDVNFKAIVLPVNLRSFSSQWFLNPLWNHARETEIYTQYAEQRREPPAHLPELSSADQLSGELWRKYVEAKTSCSRCQSSRFSEFNDVVANKVKWSAAQRSREIFQMHYGYDLLPNHFWLKELERTIELMVGTCTTMLVYLTPINHEAGIRFGGTNFSEAVSSNKSFVLNALTDLGRRYPEKLKVQDWTNLFGSDAFFTADNATEHLVLEARRRLAEKIDGALADAGTGAPVS